MDAPVPSALEDYVKIEKIGEGSYGVVFKGRHKKRGDIVAMKKVKIDAEEEGIPATSIREISMLRDIQHPNIVQLKDVLMSDLKLYLVFEFLTMDLARFMKINQTGLDPRMVKSYTHQILQGMMYCHQRRVMHRDLKPANLLLDNNGVIKIADFGCARAFGVPLNFVTHDVVTLWYRAPEILLGSPDYASPIDTWSIGTIFAEMINGKPLFPGDSEIDQLFRVFKVLGTPSEQTWPSVTTLPNFQNCFPCWTSNSLGQQMSPNCDPKALDLLQHFLQLDPNKRISAKTALLHSYFSSL